MNRLQTFEEFISVQSVQIPVLGFVINLGLAIILSFILSRIYVRYGTALTNRRALANTFMMLTITTLLIITIVKSSLALSLGLVGALSIVRFRAAIKDPEELIYLFFNIGLGLGLGADQRITTLITFAVVCVILVLKRKRREDDPNKNLYLTVSYSQAPTIEIKSIVDVLKKHCAMVDLKRFDESKDALEATFFLDLERMEDVESVRHDLRSLNESLQLTFLDNKGLA